MSRPSNPHFALLARLRFVCGTNGGFPVEGLTVEPGPDEPPKLIRGIVLADGPGGMRKEQCSWLPSGRHRLYEKLNLTIPELPTPLT